MSFSMPEIIVLFVATATGLFKITIIIEVLYSWLGNPMVRGRFRQFIEDINRPLLDFFRRFIPPLGGMIDIAPLIAFILLDLIPPVLAAILGVNLQALMMSIRSL